MQADDEFRHYILAADALLEQATREQLIEALKMLSLNFGYLVQRHGDVPQADLVRMTTAETLTDETRALVIAGMGNLIGVLGHVMAIGDDNETRH